MANPHSYQARANIMWAATQALNKWIAQGVIKEDGSNLEEIPYRETEMYLRKVMKNYEMYNKLYGIQ